MKFRLNCIPPKKTHQSSMRVFKNKSTGKMFVGRDKKGTQTESDLMSLLLPHQPEEPLQGALILKVDWIYAWRTSEPKKNKKNGILPCVTKPDCDNLAKQLQDCMTKLRFWEDDAQIFQLIFSKYYGDSTGISIEIGKYNSEKTGS